jgi:starch-binding outer membrane protein SusE/F
MMRERLFNLIIILVSAVLVLNSCLKEDPLKIKDGIYLKGKATAFINFEEGGLMKQALNEVNDEPRTGLYEIFLAVSSESDGFNIVEVVDNVQSIYGPSGNENIVLTGGNGQITGTIQKGIFTTNAGVFTVPENGLYHIIIDKQTSTYVISPVFDISLYGHATGEDWADTEIPLNSSFDISNMIFKISSLGLTEGEFRFRYNHGDKIEIIGNEVKVHTSFGGIFSGTMPGFDLSMIPGGNNYLLDKEKEGIYTLDVIWSVGEGFAAQMTETSSSSYPEKLFVIGDGISSLSGEDAWNWDLNDFEMIPVNSQPHLFWKIVWLNENGGIRLAPQKGSENDFGKEGEGEDGLYNMGEQDIPVTGMKGFYMVVVNFQSKQVSISRPEVYLIGDAVGSWDAQNPLALFSVQDAFNVLYLKRRLIAGNIRMYAWHNKGWFTYWWNTEFNVYNNEIKYGGNGSNLEPVSVIDGVYEMKFDFRKGEGSIEYCPTCSK